MSERAVRKFSGFPSGAVVATPIPNVFFSEVLPEISSLVELKVTLQVLRLLATKRGYPRYVTVADLLADAAVAAGLGAGGSAALVDGLALAVGRGTLLRLDVEGVESDGARRDLYFANGPLGRRAIAAIREGEIRIGESVASPEPASVRGERANIYALYEQNIGVLTPLLAEELADAERLYPADWLEASVRQAVGYNRRSWKYVQRILERWAVEGRRDEEAGGGAGGSGAAADRGRAGWGAR
jgi:DNA replication protein